MDNCSYNKIKLLHQISRLTGFIEKYAQKDAKAARHSQCTRIINHLHKDLCTHMEQLQKQIAKKKP